MHLAEVERLTLIPYDENEFDCADLVALVQRELFGRQIQMPGRRPRGAEGQAAIGDLSRPYARRTDTPQDGDHGPHNWLWSHEFYESDASRGFVRGYMLEAMRGSGPAVTALSGLASGHIPFGPDHHSALRKRLGRSVGFVVLCEDLPEEHNRVTLDPELKDAHGIPAPRIEYRLSENSRRMLDHAVARTTQVLEAAGAIEVVAQSPLESGGWHLMGTARMGHDPARSVVNSWGRSHDVKNLFIVDGSIFVTSAAVNPTCTIQALALYVADSMKRRLADLFD